MDLKKLANPGRKEQPIGCSFPWIRHDVRYYPEIDVVSSMPG